MLKSLVEDLVKKLKSDPKVVGGEGRFIVVRVEGDLPVTDDRTRAVYFLNSKGKPITSIEQAEQIAKEMSGKYKFSTHRLNLD